MGAMNGSEKEKGAGKPPRLPVLDGAFAITTDGLVLANNTEEGPQSGTTGSVLSWAVNDGTESAPTALISLGK